ncbi:MAG: ABC-2 type transport system ATP-binding protein [Candidatus Paceibacteria bacterium]|jgi:ABC-2 type transport system ATP-binding protein
MTAALVTFEKVGMSFGEHVALAELSFDVRPGEVFGLLGPNGAGKTTALRLICGLIDPSAGEITVGGFNPTRAPLETRRTFSYVPDGAPLYDNLSPRQHLDFVGRLHAMAEAHYRDEGERLLQALGLGDRRDDPVGQFSRGMRQKTALALALLPQPKLLVMDEPLSGLDAPTTTMFKEVIRSWAKRGGAVLYTSHLLDVVERVCDRMLILNEGRLIGLGSLAELRVVAGENGTLEQVFSKIAQVEDPVARSAALLGSLNPGG